MKIYAVKFNDMVFLRRQESLTYKTAVTRNIRNVYFFNDFEKATKVAENAGGYVIAFSEVKP